MEYVIGCWATAGARQDGMAEARTTAVRNIKPNDPGNPLAHPQGGAPMPHQVCFGMPCSYRPRAPGRPAAMGRTRRHEIEIRESVSHHASPGPVFAAVSMKAGRVRIKGLGSTAPTSAVAETVMLPSSVSSPSGGDRVTGDGAWSRMAGRGSSGGTGCRTGDAQPAGSAPAGDGQAVRLSIRMGLDVGWGDPAPGSTVRPTQSSAARPVAITGLVIPLWGAGSRPADRSPRGPISHSW